jgi:hypothetical protein
LQRLNLAIVSGVAKFTFIPDRVGKLMKASGAFPWMSAAPQVDGESALKIWYRDGERTVSWHYHLSVYGKCERDKSRQLAAMRALVAREEGRAEMRATDNA